MPSFNKAKTSKSKAPLFGVLTFAGIATFLTFGTPEGGCGAGLEGVELDGIYESQAQALECDPGPDNTLRCAFIPEAMPDGLAMQATIEYSGPLTFKDQMTAVMTNDAHVSASGRARPLPPPAPRREPRLV